jgi:phage shock protein PspC (stress-responsive transcriptional regulator)
MSTEQNPGEPSSPSPRPAGPHSGRAGSDFFGWTRSLHVTRGSDRWAGGVASGLAHRWGVDPVIVRGLFIVAAIFLGIGVLAYGVLWLLLPEPDGRIHVQEALRGRWTTGMTGALIATLLGLGGARAGFWFGDLRGGEPLWALFWIVVIGLVIFSATRSRRNRRAFRPGPEESLPYSAAPHAPGPYSFSTGPYSYGGPYNQGAYSDPTVPPPPGGQPAGAPAATVLRARRRGPGGPFAAVVVGLAVLVAGGLLALQTAGATIVDPSTGALWAIGAGIIGLSILIAGLRGRSAGILSLFAILALAAAAITQPAYQFSRPHLPVNLAPTTVQQAVSGYHVTASSGQFDLSALDSAGPLANDAVVPVSTTMSDVRIRIPKDVPVRVQADATMSNVQFGDKSIAGLGTNGSETYNSGRAGATLVVTVHATMSNVQIEQEH